MYSLYAPDKLFYLKKQQESFSIKYLTENCQKLKETNLMSLTLDSAWACRPKCLYLHRPFLTLKPHENLVWSQYARI